jgi:hypothetical protein
MFRIANTGKGSSGGLLACLMTKHAVLHAAQNPKTKYQTDVRSAHIQFYHSIFPAKDSHVQLQLREVSIGKGWSTFRVELAQGSNTKVAASADVMQVSVPRTSKYAVTDRSHRVSNFAIPGKTLPTNWELSPPAHRVDLAKLETLDDPEWACYHTAFHPNGFRRGMAYIKYYIPYKVPSQIKFVEQWVTPGWDCTPSGSRDTTTKKAKWTDELVQFAADMSLPVQENFWPPPGVDTSLGSIRATLAFSARQEQARMKGHSNWRELADDSCLPEVGPGLFKNAMINVTLSMSTEIKKKLPKDGVQWCTCVRKLRDLREAG